MIFSQERLYAEVTKRVQIAGNRCGGRQEHLSSPSNVLDMSIFDTAAKTAPDIAAMVVMRSFDPAAFAQSSLAFAFALPAAWRGEWFRAYTRTIFFAGNPANLEARFPFQYVSNDGSHGWLGPAPPQVALTLRRLLVLFRSSGLPRLTGEFCITAPHATQIEPTRTPLRRRIYIATAGLNALDYLVHLNHTLAESVLLGLIAPGDVLAIRHVPRLHNCREELAWLRVHRDNSDASRLRAYAGVSLCV